MKEEKSWKETYSMSLFLYCALNKCSFILLFVTLFIWTEIRQKKKDFLGEVNECFSTTLSRRIGETMWSLAVKEYPISTDCSKKIIIFLWHDYALKEVVVLPRYQLCVHLNRLTINKSRDCIALIRIESVNLSYFGRCLFFNVKQKCYDTKKVEKHCGRSSCCRFHQQGELQYNTTVY